MAPAHMVPAIDVEPGICYLTIGRLVTIAEYLVTIAVYVVTIAVYLVTKV